MNSTRSNFKPFLRPFIQVPVNLVDNVSKPRAAQLLNYLFKYCNLARAIVWVNQGWLARQMNINIDTLGKWIRYLVKEGFLIFAGWKDGRYKTYRIVWDNIGSEIIAPICEDFTSGENTGGPPAILPEDLRRFDRNINTKENIKINKQTAEAIKKEEIVCLPNISEISQIKAEEKTKSVDTKERHAFRESVNEEPQAIKIEPAFTTELAPIALSKIAVVVDPAKDDAFKMLRSIGYRIENAKKDVETFGAKLINKKIELMKIQENKGIKISNKAGWMNSALRKDYAAPPTEDEKIAKEAAIRAEEDKSRKAYNLCQEADRASTPKESKSLAEQSLAIKDSAEARELIAAADTKMAAAKKQQELLHQAQEKLPQEVQEQIAKNALESTRANNRFNLDEQSKLFLGIVECTRNEMLIAVLQGEILSPEPAKTGAIVVDEKQGSQINTAAMQLNREAYDRKARNLLDSAGRLMMKKDNEGAKKLIMESLAQPHSYEAEAQELLDDINKREDKKRRIEEAKRSRPKEELERILAEAVIKQRAAFKGIDESSKIFLGLVQVAFDEMLGGISA